MKITFAPKGNLSEENHGGTLEYSLLDANLKGLHPPIQCKDFLNEAFGS